MEDLLELQWKDSIQIQWQSNPKTWKTYLERILSYLKRYNFIEMK